MGYYPTLVEAGANDNVVIPLTDNDGVQAVMGRDLHAFLEVSTPYDKWFPRMVEYGFSSGQDFSTKMSESTGGRPRTDHIVSLDMAKEISMIQRTEKGKQARQYFIECEKKAKQPALPHDYASALRELASTVEVIERQKAELQTAAPKVEYHDSFIADEDTLSFRTVASNLGIKEQELREILLDAGWIYVESTSRWSASKQKKLNQNRYSEYARVKPYFHRVHHHDVPRFRGEVMYSLKITPAGATAIHRLVTRKLNQIEVA